MSLRHFFRSHNVIPSAPSNNDVELSAGSSFGSFDHPTHHSCGIVDWLASTRFVASIRYFQVGMILYNGSSGSPTPREDVNLSEIPFTMIMIIYRVCSTYRTIFSVAPGGSPVIDGLSSVWSAPFSITTRLPSRKSLTSTLLISFNVACAPTAPIFEDITEYDSRDNSVTTRVRPSFLAQELPEKTSLSQRSE